MTYLLDAKRDSGRLEYEDCLYRLKRRDAEKTYWKCTLGNSSCLYKQEPYRREGGVGVTSAQCLLNKMAKRVYTRIRCN